MPMAHPRAELEGEQRYKPITILYTGSESYIKLCVDRVTSEKVAIEFFERGTKIDDDLKCGILNHMALYHQHITTFKEVFLTATHLCVVMEYASGGDVLEFSRSHGVSEVQARWLFQQLIIALDYCHKMGIVCREIKLENALMDESPWPLLKLNAFRHSKRLGVQDATSLLKPRGSPVYIAPELIDCKAERRCKSFRAIDIWESGIFLYAMLFHSYPFCQEDDHKHPDSLKRVLQRTFTCQFSFPESTHISEECKDLIRRILVHPEQRMTLEEIQSHPWFTQDLPPGALHLNNDLRLRRRTRHQNKMEIEKIIEEAKSTVVSQE